jgi:hypothetical protein
MLTAKASLVIYEDTDMAQDVDPVTDDRNEWADLLPGREMAVHGGSIQTVADLTFALADRPAARSPAVSRWHSATWCAA